MISYSYPPYLHYSGTGVVAKNLVDILSKKNEVFVISSKPPHAACHLQKNVFQVPIFPIPHPRLDLLQFKLKSLKVAKHLIRKYDFDIFYDHEGQGVEIGKYIKRGNLNMKTVQHNHGLLEQGIASSELSRLKKWLANAEFYINTRLLNTSFEYDRIITVSEYQKMILAKYRSIPENKISVLYNPIDTDVYTNSKDKENKVVFCGFLGLRKRAHWVIEAANVLINKRGIKTNFVIIGEGAQYARLEKLVSKYRLKKYVKLTGFLTSYPKIREYQTSLVFTLPSLCESFGQTIMEAMSCGTPVVVSNNSVMKELVENGKTGLKFETFNFEEYVDRLEYLLTNDHEARRMEVSARKYVLDNFSFPVIEKKLYGICREVLE